jgi:uncharacterized repeat protein (TIGR02543 family)
MGYVFVNWSGSIDRITDPSERIVTFEMGDERSITANFVQSDPHYAVTAIVEPNDGGYIQLSDPQPAGGYQANTSVTVSAIPTKGYVFYRWAGDLGGSDNPRTILMSEDKSFTAVFNPTVATSSNPSYGGSVRLSPESSNGYAAGTEVTITATAAKGYRFDAWEGDASGSNKSITITVDKAKTVSARFVEKSSGWRWWLWAMIGVACAFGALILVRLVYARMHRGDWDELA